MASSSFSSKIFNFRNFLVSTLSLYCLQQLRISTKQIPMVAKELRLKNIKRKIPTCKSIIWCKKMHFVVDFYWFSFRILVCTICKPYKSYWGSACYGIEDVYILTPLLCPSHTLLSSLYICSRGSSVDVASCCFHFSTFEVGPNGTIVVKTPKKETHKKTPKRRSPYNSNYICRNSHFFVHFSIFEVLVGYIVPKYRSSIKYQWEMVGQIHTYMAQDGIDLFEG